MRGGRLALHALALSAALALPAAPARASFDPGDPPAGEHTQTDGPRYWVGKVVRIPIPALTEERRKEMSRHVHKLTEEGRNGVRLIRRRRPACAGRRHLRGPR